MMLLLGRTDEALRTARMIAERYPSSAAEYTVALAHWLDGDPAPMQRRWHELRTWRVDHAQEDFNLAVWSARIDASYGLVASRPALDLHDARRPRDVMMRSLSRALDRLTYGEEAAAAAEIATTLADLGVADPMVRGELRRSLVAAYVLSQVARDAIDADALGPAHERWRTLARVLLDARSGERPDAEAVGDVDEVLTAFPLAWSVELAARLVAHGGEPAIVLYAGLVDRCGERAAEVLERLRRESSELGDAARVLAERYAAIVPGVRSITAFGSLRIEGSAAGDAGVVRRVRVRQLLGLLIMRDRLAVDAVLRALWHELDAAAARNNLRITLTFLRRLVEPGREPGSPSLHIGRDATHVWLRRSAALRCDVWDVIRSLDDADARDRLGDVAGAMSLRAAGVDRWTGELLVDVRDLDLVAGDVAMVEHRLASAAAAVAAWSLARGDAAHALSVAARLLEHDPFQEVAHCVAMTAHLDLGDRRAAAAAAQRCRDALTDLRVPPSADTSTVLHRVERGYVTDRPFRRP
jgi:DNA-binding SARP family transcriptional activator